jgi:type IV fimbrial biogenesis protein FimT
MIRHKVSSRGPRQRGLTLIELMLALGVVAVLASLAVPAYGHMMAWQRLKAAAENMAVDLAELRLQAAQRGVALHLQVTPGADWCYSMTVASGCDCRVPQPCQMKTVRAKDHPGVLLVEAQNYLFEPHTGLSNAFGGGAVGALLQSTDGRQLRVAVSPLGRPRVCAPGAALPGYAPC